MLKKDKWTCGRARTRPHLKNDLRMHLHTHISENISTPICTKITAAARVCAQTLTICKLLQQEDMMTWDQPTQISTVRR
jgi:hypothetical protein